MGRDSHYVPIQIDESIHLQMWNKYRDKTEHMQKGDLQVYEECFSFACPKVLSPVVPSYTMYTLSRITLPAAAEGVF